MAVLLYYCNLCELAQVDLRIVRNIRRMRSQE